MNEIGVINKNQTVMQEKQENRPPVFFKYGSRYNVKNINRASGSKLIFKVHNVNNGLESILQATIL